jgi:AcrR family transcriptional regulator
MAAGLTLLDEGGGHGLTMRALASRLGVTPMSLYHHVGDRSGLIAALSDRVYAAVLESPDPPADPRREIEALLGRYHDAVGRHPQLTMAIFSTPEALAGVTRQITVRLWSLLAQITDEPEVWCDVLIDHAHGSGLALASARGDEVRGQAMQDQYRVAVGRLVNAVSRREPSEPR